MKKIAIYAVAAMLAISGTANAAADAVGPSLTYNENNSNATYGEVRIKGNLEGVQEGKLVSLTVYKGAVETGLTWYDQMRAGANGAYDFTCVLEGENNGDVYTFAVAAVGHDGEEVTFKYYPKTVAEGIVDSLTSESAVATAVSDYKDFLQIDTSVYDSLGGDDAAAKTEQQTEVRNSVLTEIAAREAAGETVTANDFKEIFEGCSKVKNMNESADAATFKTDLVSVITAETPASVEYFTGSDIENSLVADMMNIDFATQDEMVDYFNDKVISNAVNDVQIATDLQDVIENTAEVMGLDLTNYNALTDAKKTQALNAVLKRSNYTSCEDVVAAFETAVTAAATVQPTRRPTSGGGGSSLAPMTPSTPVVTPAPTPTPSEGEVHFKDLGSVGWAKESIGKLYDKGVVSGDENGNFNPNNNVSRAEYVKMLVSAMDMVKKNTGITFSDVSSDAWYHDYIIAAAENELVSGVGEGTFGPNTPITRQDAAVIIFRAAGIKNVALASGENATISDEAEIAGYAKAAVKALFESELLSGVGEGRFAPAENMTRAQAAVIMCNFIDRMEALN